MFHFYCAAETVEEAVYLNKTAQCCVLRCVDLCVQSNVRHMVMLLGLVYYWFEERYIKHGDFRFDAAANNY